MQPFSRVPSHIQARGHPSMTLLQGAHKLPDSVPSNNKTSMPQLKKNNKQIKVRPRAVSAVTAVGVLASAANTVPSASIITGNTHPSEASARVAVVLPRPPLASILDRNENNNPKQCDGGKIVGGGYRTPPSPAGSPPLGKKMALDAFSFAAAVRRKMPVQGSAENSGAILQPVAPC